MGVSLDGVMVPMQDGDRQGKREQARAQGPPPQWPGRLPGSGLWHALL
jgi:hypothetical protein